MCSHSAVRPRHRRALRAAASRDGNGKLVGTITTSTTNGSTDTRKLDAITASYIRAEYANETGRALDLLLTEATSTSVANFAPQIPALESILTANLK